MSSEPKLETFISRIKKTDLELEELYNNPDNLKELLWFFDEERGNEVAQKIYEEEVGESKKLYNYFKNKNFEERLGEYYQEDKSAGQETEGLEINKTKKRVITYVMLDN